MTPNGEHPATTPHAQATPADTWPVPLTPGRAYVHSSVLAGRNEHGRRVSLIRLEVYTAAGKTGLHLPT